MHDLGISKRNTPRKPKLFMLVSHAQLLKSQMRAEAFQKVSELGHVTNAGRGWRTCRATNSKLAAMLMSYGAMVSPKLNSKSSTTTVLSGEESMHSLSNQMQRKRSNTTTAWLKVTTNPLRRGLSVSRMVFFLIALISAVGHVLLFSRNLVICSNMSVVDTLPDPFTWHVDRDKIFGCDVDKKKIKRQSSS